VTDRPPMPPRPPTVSIVDDDELLVRALVRLLREEGLDARGFESAEAFLAALDPVAPGCLLLDVHLPGLDGLALQRRLAEQGAALPIVFLTGHGDIPMTVTAVKAGAVDVLTKPVDAAKLVAAVRAALAHDREARAAAARSAELRRRHASLTPREREVLDGLVGGKLNKQIAADLGIVEQTVKFHRARIMERMQAHTLAELMHLTASLPAATRTDPPAAADRTERPD
jgi:FixJ family two-component response regulator